MPLGSGRIRTYQARVVGGGGDHDHPESCHCFYMMEVSWKRASFSQEFCKKRARAEGQCMDRPECKQLLYLKPLAQPMLLFHRTRELLLTKQLDLKTSKNAPKTASFELPRAPRGLRECWFPSINTFVSLLLQLAPSFLASC